MLNYMLYVTDVFIYCTFMHNYVYVIFNLLSMKVLGGMTRPGWSRVCYKLVSEPMVSTLNLDGPRMWNLK
jgi:hypothetical protein